MTTTKIPKIGLWYQTDEGQVFEVVANDKTAGVIKRQYIDGNTDEIDLESWRSLDMQEVITPGNEYGYMEDFI